MLLLRRLVEVTAAREDCLFPPIVPLGGGDVSDGAVTVRGVVPGDEAGYPGAGRLQASAGRPAAYIGPAHANTGFVRRNQTRAQWMYVCYADQAHLERLKTHLAHYEKGIANFEYEVAAK